MIKKVIVFTILILNLFSSFSFLSLAVEIDNKEVNADGYLLFDFNHNILMAENNVDKLITPSSTAKIMTACVVLDSGITLNHEVRITKKMLDNVSGRTMPLKVGDILTVEDLLYALICGGYNDAAHVLALTVAPSLYEFANQMNKKAALLSMENTHYLNPTGMGKSGMTTTIGDIFKLINHIKDYDLFVKISSTKNYKLSDHSICEFKTITNRSSLLSKYKGIANINTGSGDDGDCAILFYKTAELSLVSIVMNARGDDKKNYAEIYSEKLISHAINDYSLKTLKTKNEIITSLPVKYSLSSQEVDLYLQKDLKAFLSDNIDIENDLSYSIYIRDEELISPLIAGDAVGSLSVFSDGVMIASIPLVINENVDKNIFLYSLDLIKQFILSRVFLLAITFFLLLIVIYLKSRKRKFKKKKRKNRKKPT